MPQPDNSSISYPKVIIWLLTARCNLKCCHCYAARFLGGKELNKDEALRVLEGVAKAGVRHIGFSGGEVFLRKDALDIIERAFGLGMTTSVVTNGTVLSEEIAQGLACYGTLAFLSIDGERKETHERIRGEGTWDAAILAAERLRKFGVKFSTIMAAGKLNYGEGSGNLSLARKLGAKGGCLIPMMPAGRASGESILEAEEMVTLLQGIEKAANELKFPVSLWCTPFARLVVKSKYVFASYCRSAAGGMDIGPHGNVLLCDVLDIVVSNVREKEVLQAWREQENNPLAKSLTRPKLPSTCLDCPLSQECRGGCFARAQLMAGDIYAPDPLCPRVAGLI